MKVRPLVVFVSYTVALSHGVEQVVKVRHLVIFVSYTGPQPWCRASGKSSSACYIRIVHKQWPSPIVSNKW